MSQAEYCSDLNTDNEDLQRKSRKRKAPVRIGVANDSGSDSDSNDKTSPSRFILPPPVFEDPPSDVGLPAVFTEEQVSQAHLEAGLSPDVNPSYSGESAVSTISTPKASGRKHPPRKILKTTGDHPEATLSLIGAENEQPNTYTTLPTGEYA